MKKNRNPGIKKKRDANICIMDLQIAMEVMFGFLKLSSDDHRIGPVHISLFMAIFYFWRGSGFCDSFHFKSKEIMNQAKISGRATYTRCIHDLHNYGYLKYVSSNHPSKGGRVWLSQSDESIRKM